MNAEQRAEMIIWIGDFGSAELQQALALGVVDSVVPQYRTDRIALERAGWTWAPDYPATLYNPTQGQLDALAAVIGDVPDAYLGYLKLEGLNFPQQQFIPFATQPDPSFRNFLQASTPVGVLAAPFLWGFIWKATGQPTPALPPPPPHA